MVETILFKPSKELLVVLFKYHKATRKNLKKTKTPSDQIIQRVQKEVGMDFRRALLVFANKIQPLPIRLCAIIEKGKFGFTDQLNEILRGYLRIGSDDLSIAILEKLAQEFKDWLKNTGEELKAEREYWSYKRIYLLDNHTVIMELNYTGLTVDINVH